MPEDNRQIARRETEPRRVEATADDVTTSTERLFSDALADEASRRLREAHARWEEELFYGYVGGQKDHERLQRQARRHASKRIIDRAIDEVKIYK